jgi:ABC-2 type transport system permease protein
LALTLLVESETVQRSSPLLTPANRRQIIMGKFLAAFSIWPVAYVIAIPYLYVLAQGDAVLGPALFWGAVTGTILMVGYTAVGMLVSFWSGTNKVSYFIALGIYAALLIPAELPGKSAGAAGQFMQWINPMASVNHFLSKHLVNYRSFAEFWTWLITALVLAVVSMAVLFFVGAGLRLEPGRKSKLWARIGRAFGATMLIGMMLVSLFMASPASAFQEETPLAITIDTDAKHVKTGIRW